MGCHGKPACPHAADPRNSRSRSPHLLLAARPRGEGEASFFLDSREPSVIACTVQPQIGKNEAVFKLQGQVNMFRVYDNILYALVKKSMLVQINVEVC